MCHSEMHQASGPHLARSQCGTWQQPGTSTIYCGESPRTAGYSTATGAQKLNRRRMAWPKALESVSLFLAKNQCSHCAILMRSTGYFSINEKCLLHGGRKSRFALFLCHFCRLSATEYTDMDHGTGAYGSHGRFIR